MALSVSISTTHFELAFGPANEENIRIGPLTVYLGWRMQGVAWADRFDFICEAAEGWRPKSGKWFETWTDSDGARCGYLLGRQWRLVREVEQADA